jgi:undecaprenyl-diphosphatase
MYSFLQFDKYLMTLLNFHGNVGENTFWYYYSDLYIWIPLILTVFVMLWRNCSGSNRKKIAFILACVLLVTVTDQVSSSIIKPIVERLRPSHDPSVSGLLYYVNGYRGGRYGFVSGHATNIVAIVTWLFLIFRNRLTRFCLVIYAVAMCYSRIYLGVHFPFDILFGALLGFGISYASFFLVRKHFDVVTEKCPKAILGVLSMTVFVLAAYSTYEGIFIV